LNQGKTNGDGYFAKAVWVNSKCLHDFNRIDSSLLPDDAFLIQLKYQCDVGVIIFVLLPEIDSSIAP
jgi:hypothetical protein